MSKINWGTIDTYKNLKTKDGQSLLAKLLNTYSEKVFEELGSIKTCNQKEDFENAGKIAHKLKSSSGNLGLQSVYEGLNKIEILSNEPSTKTKDDIAALIQSIEVDINEALPSIRDNL
jgi:HPt (histidine-containing phosphotransfer) domain-containing protein